MSNSTLGDSVSYAVTVVAETVCTYCKTTSLAIAGLLLFAASYPPACYALMIAIKAIAVAAVSAASFLALPYVAIPTSVLTVYLIVMNIVESMPGYPALTEAAHYVNKDLPSKFIATAVRASRPEALPASATTAAIGDGTFLTNGTACPTFDGGDPTAAWYSPMRLFESGAQWTAETIGATIKFLYTHIDNGLAHILSQVTRAMIFNVAAPLLVVAVFILIAIGAYKGGWAFSVWAAKQVRDGVTYGVAVLAFNVAPKWISPKSRQRLSSATSPSSCTLSLSAWPRSSAPSSSALSSESAGCSQ